MLDYTISVPRFTRLIIIRTTDKRVNKYAKNKVVNDECGIKRIFFKKKLLIIIV